MIGAANPGITRGYSEEGFTRVVETHVLAVHCVQANWSARCQVTYGAHPDTKSTKRRASSPRSACVSSLLRVRETSSFCEAMRLEECVVQSSCEERKRVELLSLWHCGKSKGGWVLGRTTVTPTRKKFS